MNHTKKKTLARRLQTREERKEKGRGIFQSVAWESRKDAIKKRITKD